MGFGNEPVNKKNLAIYAVVFFTIFLVEFGLNSYLSFNLNEKQYLFYQNIINLLPLFTTLVGFGTPFAVVYMTSLSKDNKEIFVLESNLFVLYFSLSLLVIVAMLYNIKYIELYVLVALVLGFFNAIKQNSVNFFLAKKELNKSSFIRLNQKIIYLVVIVFVISFAAVSTDKNLSFALILGELLGFIILITKYKLIIIKKFKKIKSILKISRYAFFANVFNMISLATPILLLNYFDYPTNEIIAFSIAYTLLRYSGILLGPFMQLITPYFTPIKNDLVKVKELYKKYSILLFIIGITISVFMYFLSEYIIDLFFNNIYSEAIELFRILVFAIPFLFINSFTSALISSIISVKLLVYMAFSILMLTLIGNYIILNTQYNIESIAYFILVSYILSYSITMLMFVKHYKYRIMP